MTITLSSIVRRLPRARGAFAAGLAVALAACGGSIVDAPEDDIIVPDAVSGRDAIPTLVNGVRGDLALAFSGDDGGIEGLILVSGLVADEFNSGDTFPTRVEMDRRQMRELNVSLTGVERNLQRARAAAEFAVDRVRGIAPEQATTIAELLTAGGLVSVAFGENYCSGVPFSRIEGSELVLGAPLTTTQLFQSAVAKADSAITALTGLTSTAANRQRWRANVLKGRALLNLGQFAAAAAAVASVPTNFVDSIAHNEATARTTNGVFAFNSTAIRRWTVANGTGASGPASAVLAYGALNDPRAPTALAGIATFDGRSNLRLQLKYPSKNAGVPIFSGVEARMIEAEAALQAGDPDTFIAELNDARANNGRVAGLAPLVDPVTPTARENLLFRERALWLFATAHRLGDSRRLIRQYLRSQADVFPTGAYFKGGTYGTDVNIPITQPERNNANFTGCLNRDA